jgi:hypothetical protein
MFEQIFNSAVEQNSTSLQAKDMKKRYNSLLEASRAGLRKMEDEVEFTEKFKEDGDKFDDWLCLVEKAVSNLDPYPC